MLPGCGSVESSTADGGIPADAGPPKTVTLHPDAQPLPGETECTVVITTGIVVPGAVHVPFCTDVDYATNPPSGGDHWGMWAAFKQYSLPVPREMYVHNQEHGGVVLLYRCGGSCPEVVTMLQDVLDGMTPDPLCVSGQGLPRVRALLTPDPELDTPVAAAAWGATYTATCLDPESLSAFVAEVYGKGTETTCYNGQDLEPPDGSVSLCPDGGADADGG